MKTITLGGTKEVVIKVEKGLPWADEDMQEYAAEEVALMFVHNISSGMMYRIMTRLFRDLVNLNHYSTIKELLLDSVPKDWLAKIAFSDKKPGGYVDKHEEFMEESRVTKSLKFRELFLKLKKASDWELCKSTSVLELANYEYDYQDFFLGSPKLSVQVYTVGDCLYRIASTKAHASIVVDGTYEEFDEFERWFLAISGQLHRVGLLETLDKLYEAIRD